MVSVGRPLLVRGSAGLDLGPTSASKAVPPADPSRWHSTAGPEALRRVRVLLGGY